MQYRRISADCHLDMPWMPPDLFVSEAPRELKDRMPYVADGPQGPQWVAKNGANFGLQERRWTGRRALCPRAEPPRRQDGRDRPLRGRQKGHPALQRPASADQGHGPRRRRRRGHLRHPRRRLAAQRQRSRERDAAHLQRLAQGFLQPLSRSRDRPRLPALWRHRRGGRGDPPRRQDGHQGARTVLLLGHGADVAPDVGAVVEGGQATCSCRCISTPSRRLRRGRAKVPPARSDARRCSPACPRSR